MGDATCDAVSLPDEVVVRVEDHESERDGDRLALPLNQPLRDPVTGSVVDVVTVTVRDSVTLVDGVVDDEPLSDRLLITDTDDVSLPVELRVAV